MFSKETPFTPISLASKLMCLLLFICSTLAHAENKGLFWEVEKDGQMSYLLGSVHFADSSFYPLSSSIMSAYERSDALLVEVDESRVDSATQAELVARYGFYPPGQTIKQSLAPKTIDLVSELLSEFRISLEAVQNYRPAMVAVSLTSLQAGKLGYTPEQGLDAYFLQKARGAKPIRQLETFEFQMKLLAELPEDKRILHASFEEMRNYKETWQGMMGAWKKGDAKAMYQIAIGDSLKKHPSLSPYFDILFFDRHEAMVNGLESCFGAKESCFMVVGAGHMLGNKGIVALLQRKGYHVRQL